MMNFADQLGAKIRQTNNPTVMGLDPVLDYVPEGIRSYFREQCDDAALASGLAIFEFNRRLIDNTCDLIPAVKLQLAYYEQYGIHGLEALRQTLLYARQKNMLVIADAKRNDIGSTASAYARAFLGETTLIDGTRQAFLDADAITLNGYLGLDGIQPFLEYCEGQGNPNAQEQGGDNGNLKSQDKSKANGKGVFILVRTSNPSAGDLQDLILSDGRSVFEAMAEKVAAWGERSVGLLGYSSVGAVVGATWPLQASRLRRLMPKTFILIPGYGTQGATADDAVRSFGPDGGGAIVNASRSLMCAWKNHDMPIEQFDLAARLEAKKMRDELERALNSKLGLNNNA